ncbi:MAG: folylpolyglutamate synthase/dihydrofolate synthase family protein [Bacteroidota bacterium]|nr:folylpolyglutamate synthase/dihydrofolate synthase family protein [Bacteroidota bacterium]MDP4288038.1 folylpolyglutamate synthase/dihydrofolate synthase family protein [Bacteroidota bacterium]
MSDYSQRLDALFQLEFFGMKLGLENIRALLDLLGHPERMFPSIHIAGTNGKGSVAAMLAAVQQSAGKRTGLYTSPHLVDFRERIRIDGEMISEEEVTNFLARIWPNVEALRATFFEVTTAMAFDHFARHHVDIAIIETGLGGRLDATNVLEKPLATVITSIGYDHMQILGPTLESIASEKAGIFKFGSPAVVNCSPQLESTFKQRARETRTPITFVRSASIRPVKGNAPFIGEHQVENVQTVIATLAILPRTRGQHNFHRGIEDTAKLTGLRARLEEVKTTGLSERGVRLFLDVGHNVDALLRVKDFFTSQGIRPIVAFGIMRDKDVAGALNILHGFASRFVALQAETPRALPSSDLHQAAIEAGLDSIDGGTVPNGVRLAMSLAVRGDTILVSGSHYVCGEFLRAGDLV